MLCAILVVALIASVAALAPVRSYARLARPTLKMSVGPTYWEGSAPPSSVLGVGEKIPSSVFWPLSLIAFVVGTYCAHESNILNQITLSTINPLLVGGTFLVPISWGLHVAAWIQKQNGK